MGGLGAHKLTSLPNDCEAVDSHKAAWQIRVWRDSPRQRGAARASSDCSQAVGIWVLYLNYQEVQGKGGQPITDFLRESSK